MNDEVWMMSEKSIIEKKSFDFAIKIVKICRYLSDDLREKILSKQLMRAGTSIGANVAEAERGQSRADFLSKMNIALKEANESEYWLRLLKETNYIDNVDFKVLHDAVEELIRMLSSICKTTSQQPKK